MTRWNFDGRERRLLNTLSRRYVSMGLLSMNRKSREGTQPIQGCGFTLPQSQGAPPFLVLLLALPADYPASGHIRPIWVIGKGGEPWALKRNPVGIQFSGGSG